MKISEFFLPIIKENPSEAQVVSHRLMLRAGMIRQLTAGIYNWLPLGFKVLNNVKKIVQEEMERAGAIELLMPTMQPVELWQESGRGDYGDETLKVTDRHKRAMIYGPTNEEVITDIFRQNVKSYKQLPLNLFHVQWKFRDEIRPRFGVMRGREFLMKDAYSFDINEENAKKSYNNMYRAYFKIFHRLGLSVIPFVADTGAIGGSMSHEFQVIAETGESQIYYDPAFENISKSGELDIEALQKLYAAADEKHDPAIAPKNVKSARGIEVGHVFYLGEKYSGALGAKVTGPDGSMVTVKMGCYGIGVSRLVAAIIEASHDDKGIIWPESVSPFKVSVINLKKGDVSTDKISEDIYAKLKKAGIDVLLDDSEDSIGSKFATHELIGIPYNIVVGPKGAKENKVEFKVRKTLTKEDLSPEEAINRVVGV